MLISYRYANVTKNGGLHAAMRKIITLWWPFYLILGHFDAGGVKKMTLSADGFPIFEYLCSIIATVI